MLRPQTNTDDSLTESLVLKLNMKTSAIMEAASSQQGLARVVSLADTHSLACFSSCLDMWHVFDTFREAGQGDTQPGCERHHSQFLQIMSRVNRRSRYSERVQRWHQSLQDRVIRVRWVESTVKTLVVQKQRKQLSFWENKCLKNQNPICWCCYITGTVDQMSLHYDPDHQYVRTHSTLLLNHFFC